MSSLQRAAAERRKHAPPPQVVPYEPVPCKQCGGVLNPYASVDYYAKVWICPFCYSRNHFPAHYQVRRAAGAQLTAACSATAAAAGAAAAVVSALAAAAAALQQAAALPAAAVM